MHVLILTSEYGPFVRGGLGTHVNQLVTHLIAAGIQITVGLATHECVAIIHYKEGLPHWYSCSKPDVASMSWHDGQMKVNSDLVTDILRLFPEVPFDLVHSHDWLSFPIGRDIIHRARRPHVTTIHVLQDMQKRVGYEPHPQAAEIERSMIVVSDHVIVVSKAIEQMIAHRPEAHSGHVSVIYNWIEPSEFGEMTIDDVASIRRQLAPAGEQIVLYVGRLSVQKGIRQLLMSARIVRTACPDTRWIMIGRQTVQNMQPLQPFLEDSSQHVTFLGELPRHSLRPYYQAADCVVVPSVYEPFGLVAIEAMASGTAVIVSDVDGLREIVRDGHDGLRVPQDCDSPSEGPDIGALAEAQIHLLRDQVQRVQLATTAQETVKTRFSREKMIPQIIGLYARVIVQSSSLGRKSSEL